MGKMEDDRTGQAGSNYFNTDRGRGHKPQLMSHHHHHITPNLSSNPTTSNSSNPSLPSFSSSLVSKVVTEMECVEAALKSSFRREVVTGKVGLQPFAEEFCGGVAVATCEDFLVDELFDFSNEEDLVGGMYGEEEEEDEEKVREQKNGLEGEGAVVPCGSADSVGKEDLPAVQTGELSVPDDDLADLEWLSHFVEDSFSGFSSPFPFAVIPGKANFAAQGKEGAKAEVAGVENRVFKTPVNARARRSQRPRTGGKGWMLGSPSLSDTSSSSSSSSSSNCITSDTVTLAYVEPSKPTKKQRKWGNYGSGLGQTAARKCSHCGVQKTPQWRAGPLGSKTLCNACGVRFKSGRLFPEYRPACSPTFSIELHSNHHRKVLEMRRKKESSLPVQPEPGFDHLLESLLV